MHSIQNKLSLVYAFILLVIFTVVYSSVFDKKIDLGGDNISYYVLGTSIASGNGYTNVHHAEQNSHHHYPPGYSTLIAGIQAIFSKNITIIKWFNGLFFYVSLVLLLFIFNRSIKNIHLSFLVCLILLFNFHLLSFSFIMMSEIPFLFFSLIVLLLCSKINATKTNIKNWVLLGLIILVTLCIYIRSIGIVLLLSVFIYYLLNKERLRGFIFSASCLLLYLPWIIRNKTANGGSYIQQLLQKNPYNSELGQHNLSSFFGHIFSNIERYITKEIPYGLFSAENIVYDVSKTPLLDWSVGIFILAIILLGVCINKHFKHLIFIYTTLFFGILIIWPQVWYGTRFMLPILPFLVYYFISGIRAIILYLKRMPLFKSKPYFKPAISLILICIWGFSYAMPSVMHLHQKANAAYPSNYKNYFELANWVKNNSKAHSITCVRKEMLFYFYSNKSVVTFKQTLNLEAQIEFLKAKKVDYVVVDQLGFSSTYRFLYPAIERYPKKFKIIKTLNNPNTYLMEFKPNLGYWGSWKNNQRNGYGSYLWEDGQKYEGYWSNNVRHGKGVLHLTNGEKLVGEWTNGTLNGKVEKQSEAGVIIEIAEYLNNKKINTLERR